MNYICVHVQISYKISKFGRLAKSYGNGPDNPFLFNDLQHQKHHINLKVLSSTKLKQNPNHFEFILELDDMKDTHDPKSIVEHK